MKAIYVLIAIFGFYWPILAQTSEITAQKIMGDKFISADLSRCAWEKLDTSLEKTIIPEMIIDYPVDTLKAYVSKPGKWFLIPTIGLKNASLARFWTKGLDIKDTTKISTISYHLINLALPLEEEMLSTTSYQEQLEMIAANNGALLSMNDYLEILATLSLVKEVPVSLELTYFMITDQTIASEPEKLMLTFSTYGQEVVTMPISRRKFVAGYLDKDMAYYLEGDDLETMVFVPFAIKLSEAKEFFVFSPYAIRH